MKTNKKESAETTKKNTTLETLCPRCQMPKKDWPGGGYEYEGVLYCCDGCAHDTGCACLDEEVPYIEDTTIRNRDADT